MSLEEYSLLKLIALEWSLGRPPRGRILEVLRDRYGVGSLVELDRVIHRMHRELMESLSSDDVRASGDGLVIVGLLAALGHSPLSAEGDGWRRPLSLMMENATVAVRLGVGRAVVVFDVDSSVDEVGYVFKYYDGIDGVMDEIDVRTYDDELLEVRDLDPYVADMASGAVEDSGFELVGEDVEGGTRVYRYRYDGPASEGAAVLREILAAYTVIAREGVPEPRIPDSLRRVEEFLERVKAVLPVDVVVRGLKFTGIHHHDEVQQVDVHVAGEVALRGEPGVLLPSIVALAAGLDHNFEEERADFAVSEAVRALKSFSPIVDGFSGASERRYAVE